MTKTMFLPGFSHRLCGRRTQAAAGKVQRQTDRLDGLAALVARFIPMKVFAPGDAQRERIYTPWVTFVSFLGQVLTRGSACRETVRRVQAWCVAAKRTPPDENTSAYCQARARLPVAILLASRMRFHVAVPGFRTKDVVLVTTLLDEKAYPDEAIITLYRRRWAVELCFRDIKTTLGLDVLRCHTPELVEKEVWLQAMAYNLVRALMLEAAWTHGVELERLSFKGTVDSLRQWTPLFAPTIFVFKRARQELLRVIAADLVPLRPNRSEPRARKRRPKAYQLLTRPRHSMIVSPSRALK